MHEPGNKARIRTYRRVVVRRLGILTGQRRVVFDDVVFGETIKVDGSSIPTEKDTRKGQEISQWFCKVVHTLHRPDEGVDCEVPAVTVTDTR